jgi:hypothetical protein
LNVRCSGRFLSLARCRILSTAVLPIMLHSAFSGFANT